MAVGLKELEAKKPSLMAGLVSGQSESSRIQIRLGDFHIDRGEIVRIRDEHEDGSPVANAAAVRLRRVAREPAWRRTHS